MLVYIRSCKYCGNNPDCSYKREIRESFKPLRLEATAVVNCKRVRPFHEIGEKVFISIYAKAENTLEASFVDREEETSRSEEIVSGFLAGYVFDRYGRPRTYAVRIPRSYVRNFDPAYYADGEQARLQFPEVKLGEDEIIVFVRYTSIERTGDNAE